ncbi:hypothetical protein KBY66_06685 [Synechococcus sp. Tobar12-5m-g]|uniref:WD40 domain-containing protein n=1 Tax=unclassified Synechococcus TaxID=2626047 RepID=UPI0020CEF8CF|nr:MULTISPECIES: hypothetical protein [unclassified Synechococcus]MCP9772309.1 hypothetical protein [Synechococcus sp. Tobar12-5m-g]MCP9873251.1 hypothetical protein [Synechococcus sp. Cruz CV-v-12]
MSSPTCPYKGLAAFDEADADIFFGRDKEKKQLIDYLKSCRLTVLYGKHSVGQTSLLQAGVVHELHRLAQQNIENFSFPQLAVIIFKDWQEPNPLMSLVKQVRNEIEELIPGHSLPPRSIEPDSFEDILVDYSKALDRGDDQGMIYIILDEFEEYFLYHPQPEMAENSFEAEFPNAVNHLGLNVNFLIAVDEDFLSKLDRFKGAIPDIIRNRLPLLPLDEDAIYEAIVNPIFKKYNSENPNEKVGIAPDLIDEIIKDLVEVNFDTACLQLVMQCLWAKERNNKSDLLRLVTFQDLGRREKIIKYYFNEQIKQLAESAKPNAVKVLAKIVGYLITPGGTKIAYPVEDLAKQAGMGEAELRTILKALQRQNLLNPVSCPTNPSQICYEISHSILAEAILEWHNHYWMQYNRAKYKAQLTLDTVVPKALEQFAESSQLNALRTIANAGETLQNAIKEDLLPRGYSSDSLRSVLEHILDNIQEILELSGHKGAACSVIFAPDGKRLASSSEDGTVRLWNRQGTLLKIFKEPRNWIWGIDFSPDGRYLVSACDDGTARLWDLHSQGNPLVLIPYPAPIRDVAFSPDGKLVAIAGTDGKVRLCDLEGNERLQFLAAQGPIWCISFSPHGNYFATGSNSGSISLWDLAGMKLRDWEAHDAAIWSVNFNKEGTMLASGSSDNSVKLWNPETGKKYKTLRGHKGWVFSVRFHPQNLYLASASEDCTVRIWDFDGSELAKLVHAAPVQGIGFSPEGELLASACGDRKIHLWNLQRLPQVKRQEGSLLSSSFSHDGQYLATASSGGTVCLWDVQRWDVDNRPLKQINVHASWVKQVSFSPTAFHFATASADGTASLWDVEGNRLQSFKGHQNSVWSINFSPDGQLLVTGSADKTIRLWNLQGQQQCEWLGAKGPIWSVSFSPDDKFLASGADDGSVCLWDLQGKKVCGFSGGKSPILSVNFSPDCKYLVGSSSAGKLYVWNWKTRKLFTDFTHDPAIPIWSACFSPCSRYLVSGSLDRNAYLWDLECKSTAHAAVPTRLFRGHKGPVRAVSFSPDGLFVVTASSDGTVRKWSATLQEFDMLLNRAREWLSFTP